MIFRPLACVAIGIVIATASGVGRAGDAADKVHEISAGLKLTGELGKAQAIPYKVKLIAGKTYVIDMVSPNQKALDPFLRLLDATGKQLAEDDDGGEGLNARIVFRVEVTGAYQIVATCFGNGAGPFTLTIREGELPGRAKEQSDPEDGKLALPKVSPAGLKGVDELLRLCVEAGALKFEKLSPNAAKKFTVADAAKLRKTVADHRALLTPAVRDTLVVFCNRADEVQEPSVIGLLRGLGEEVRDQSALAFAAFFDGMRSERRQDYVTAVKHFQEAATCFKTAKDAGWQLRALNYAGMASADQGKYDEALARFTQALAVARDEMGHDPAPAARCLINLGAIYRRKGDYKQALSHHLEALAVLRKIYKEDTSNIASCLHNIGFVYQEQANHGTALKYFTEALAIKRKLHGDNDPGVANTLNSIGIVHLRFGSPAKALDYCQQALDIRLRAHGKFHSAVAESLNNLGTIRGEQGDFTRALEYHEQAVDIVRKVLAPDHPMVATCMNNLGMVYANLQDLAKARACYSKALAIARKIRGDNHFTVATTLNNLALVSSMEGDYRQAAKHHEEALTILRKIYGDKHSLVATSLNNLGTVSSHLGDDARAIELHMEAVKIDAEVFGKHNRTVAVGLYNAAMAFRNQGLGDAALDGFTGAVQALRRSPAEKPGPVESLHAADLQPLLLTVQAVYERGRTMERMLGRSPGIDKLEACRDTYALAAAVLERTRADVLETETSKVFHVDDTFEIIPAAIGICGRLFNRQGRAQDLETAFALAEQGTARVFVEALGKTRARFLAGVSVKFLTDEKQLLEDLRLLDMRLDKELAGTLEQRDTALIAQLLDQRRQGDDKLKQLIGAMDKEYPRYSALKYPRPCKLEEARACLGADEVALVMIPGTHGSRMMLIEGQPKVGDSANGLAIVELPKAATLAEHVAALTDLGTLATPARVKALGREAYDAILGPCRDRIKDRQLVIVPNGALCFLPFELLVAEDGKYLVEKHRVRYAPSLTALHLIGLWKQKRVEPEVPLFAVGDPVYDAATQPGDSRLNTVTASRGGGELLDLLRREGRADAFKRLVHSGTEVARIAELLDADREYVLTGEDASEAKVKQASAAQRLARARYVHFATHGILGLDKGKQPALVLNLVGNTGEDGFLEYEEILNLKLNADVVVLSACRTGQGKMARGEGVTGLARAFLYAGSKGVVCSLWSVDDRETANLMVDFYGHLQKGQSAADALREAQLAMIRAGNAPLYWAPFILIGE